MSDSEAFGRVVLNLADAVENGGPIDPAASRITPANQDDAEELAGAVLAQLGFAPCGVRLAPAADGSLITGPMLEARFLDDGAGLSLEIMRHGAAVEVLEHNGITVFAPEFRCCGMPALDGGDVPRATSWAQHNVEILKPYVEAGCDIVSPGPTCSFMMKKEWKDYLGSSDAEAVSARAFDLMEYLFNLRKSGELKEDYTEDVGSIGYHVPCHLKVQKIGFRSRDIMKKLPGAKVKLVDQCSCMDGTWGMKKEYYDLSKKGAEKLMNGLTEDKPATLSSDCLIAKLQIEEGSGQKVVHPIEILWKAYGGKP
jgi:Fe-S oxidoreductase